MSLGPARRLGGRPTAQASLQLETTILDAATTAFLADGYAATSIETIAKTCHVAKRTIYTRWNGKPVLFRAVVDRMMTRWLSGAGDWPVAEDLETELNTAASRILMVALTPDAIALHRLLIAEGARFPELPHMMHQAGAGQGTARIKAILDGAVSRGTLPAADTAFAAEQFIHLVLAGPQRRALGLGQRLDEAQLGIWQKSAVTLFLRGVRS